MPKSNSTKFHGRSFTSFFSVLSFLIMTISGIFLYFAPPGRIAHWSHWKFLALTKEQWQAVHTIFSLAFIIIIGFHIYYNWSPLINYFKKKMQSGINRKKELLWSSVLTIALTIFTIAGVPPFSTIMDWGESLSNSWSNERNEPPIPHAEAMSLQDLSETLQIPLNEIMETLKRKGINPENEHVIVEELAAKYGLTPSQLFQKIRNQGQSSRSAGDFRGGGYGRKTVEDVCKQLNLSVKDGLANLKLNGIQAKSNENIREISSRHNLLPRDIIDIIQHGKK